MKIVYFFRKAAPSFFSIEVLFQTIISNLRHSVAEKVFLPYKSATSPAALLENTLYASKRQGQVNHITGDVYYIALALDKKKTILTIHDIDSLGSKNRMKNFLLHLLWLKIPVRRVRYVTVISEYSKRKVLAATGVAADKVIVIPNCVQLTDKDFKPKVLLNKQEPVLLQVGTKSNKNFPNVVEAIKGISCRLLILGKLAASQRELLEENGIVYENFFSLDYEEVIKLYYRADIVTFVSTYEGFGMPILEANALGRPVITSTTTAMPEVAGEGAVLVDPFKPEQIRQAIIDLVADDTYRNNIVNKGYQNVQRFKPEMVAAKYEALYKRVLEENS
ncbi:glycosyltransferase family 1 protein [Pontibacter diazotrophicus]|uniref:Glycosyltransferase family 1 protein n=1 Tax=Pontibacter diazotrophicus TaxID=1400979 RepID=A0A3D8LBT4_9BACT|nr:glycosyltransferase family 1 protein [Pontibacter diazotrophicus]RDV14857.1 glycosyltransferase family 1 protein [Pontibacter diazotrophicus]